MELRSVLTIFDCRPSSPVEWLIAGDYLEESTGSDDCLCCAIREMAYVPEQLNGNGRGYGSGRGYGNGRG